jgi:hypothetical protein
MMVRGVLFPIQGVSMARTSARAPTSPEKEAPKTTGTPTPAPVRSGPTHEQIARRAYEIFLARGGQHGHHEQDWFQAERELRLGRQ